MTPLRIFAMLAALFSASPAMAVTVPHPKGPIFNACAVDMDVSGEIVADRILAVGWTETNLTPEIQKLGQDHLILQYFLRSLPPERDIRENWDWSLDEVFELYGIYPYENRSETIRSFEDPDRSGFAVLTYRPDGLWSCEIVLTAVPVGGSQFMSSPSENGERLTADGIIQKWEQDRRSDFIEFVGLFPFLPSPKRYYANYFLTDPDAIQKQYSYSINLAFSAHFGTI